MRSRTKFKLIAGALSLLCCALLFQNCSAAAPPDISNLTQASTGVPTSSPTPSTPPTPTPSPVATPPPPVSQTYSWSVGAWSICSSGVKSRSVSCVSSLGGVVGDAFCTTSKPSASDVCSSYTCTVTLSLPSEFFPAGFCAYSCVSSVTYYAFANDASFCNANPIGVAGTETVFSSDYSQQLARPFSYCTVTQALTLTSSGYSGTSVCE